MTLLNSKEILLAFTIIASSPLQGCENDRAKSDSKVYEYIEVISGKEIERDDVCHNIRLKISSSGNKLALSTQKARFIIDTEEDDSGGEIIAGDFWQNGRCFIAVKSGSGLVNESFDIYRVDQESESTDGHSTQTLINPEFREGSVISTYRDASRWHYEELCYSEERGAPYLCEKRTALDDEIQKLISCDEARVCQEPMLVHSGTKEIVRAVVSSDRAYLLRGGEKEDFIKTSSYLIRNDRVLLLDFFDSGPQLYFKISFSGANGNTVGWISAGEISLRSR